MKLKSGIVEHGGSEKMEEDVACLKIIFVINDFKNSES